MGKLAEQGHMGDHRNSLGDMNRVDILGTRRKERLANDLLKIHGADNLQMINTGLEKIDSRNLTGLTEDEYQSFLQGVSKHLGQQSMNQLRSPDSKAQPSQANPSDYGSPGKRNLPVAAKQMIFNEWGAVIQHQDEMDKALKQDDKLRHKDIQNRYRQDLEEQKADIARKVIETQMHDAALAVDALKY